MNDDSDIIYFHQSLDYEFNCATETIIIFKKKILQSDLSWKKKKDRICIFNCKHKRTAKVKVQLVF